MAGNPRYTARVRVASGEFGADGGDFEKIVQFLNDNKNDFVADREKAAVESAFDTGNVLLFEVAAGDNGSHWIIEGCAFVYELLGGAYIEIGTINIPTFGGFDLQKLFIALTGIRFIVGHERPPTIVFATFNPKNERQFSKLREAFMVPWDDPGSDLVAAKSETVTRGSDHPVFFRFSPEFVSEACRYLVAILDREIVPTRVNRYTKISEELYLQSIDHFVTRRLMTYVRDVAKH